MAAKRPLSVLIIGWLFIAAGILGFVNHATEFKPHGPFEFELIWTLIVRLLAIVGGVFLLRGANWARWLVLAWIGYHVGLGALHSILSVIIHCAFLAGVALVLFRSDASQYFRTSKRGSVPLPQKETP